MQTMTITQADFDKCKAMITRNTQLEGITGKQAKEIEALKAKLVSASVTSGDSVTGSDRGAPRQVLNYILRNCRTTRGNNKVLDLLDSIGAYGVKNKPAPSVNRNGQWENMNDPKADALKRVNANYEYRESIRGNGKGNGAAKPNGGATSNPEMLKALKSAGADCSTLPHHRKNKGIDYTQALTVLYNATFETAPASVEVVSLF